MSIFKHNSSSKCLSFGDFGSSYNGNSIKLEECPPNINPSQFGDSKNNTYKINSNGQCALPNNSNNLILGDCNNENSKFSIYHPQYSQPNENSNIEEIKVQFVFSGGNDNVTIDTSHKWQKKLTNVSHKNTYKNF